MSDLLDDLNESQREAASRWLSFSSSSKSGIKFPALFIKMIKF